MTFFLEEEPMSYKTCFFLFPLPHPQDLILWIAHNWDKLN